MHFKLQKKPELLKEYDQIIMEQLSSGVIEEVPEKDIENLEADNSQSQEPQRKLQRYTLHPTSCCKSKQQEFETTNERSKLQLTKMELELYLYRKRRKLPAKHLNIQKIERRKYNTSR
jgi:hypothetical protein